MTGSVARARRSADELLFPAAGEVDRLGAVPREHLDALAAAGLYGLVGPAAAGRLDADEATANAVIEALVTWPRRSPGCSTSVWSAWSRTVRGPRARRDGGRLPGAPAAWMVHHPGPDLVEGSSLLDAPNLFGRP